MSLAGAAAMPGWVAAIPSFMTICKWGKIDQTGAKRAEYAAYAKTELRFDARFPRLCRICFVVSHGFILSRISDAHSSAPNPL